MANADLGTLTARLNLDTAGAQAAVGRLSGTLGGLLKGAIGLAAAYLSFSAVKNVVEDATSAFGAQQTATVLLNQALKDTGQKWTPALQKALAATGDSLLKYGDNSAVVDGALQKLVLRGVPAAAALGDLGQIANFAATAHLSLSDATDVLVKAVSGRMSPALKELGATTLPKGVTGVDALNRILGQIAPSTAGAANALSTTMPGAMAQFGATITDKVMVPLGGFINKGLIAMIPLITDAANWLGNNLTPALNDLGGFITTNVIPPLSTLWGWFSKSILPIFTQVGNWITSTLVPNFQALADSFNKHVAPALKPIVAFFGTATTGLLWAVTTIGEFIANTLLGALKTLSDNFKTLETPLAGVVASFVIWKGVAVGGAIITLLQGMIAATPGLALFAVASATALAPWLALALAAAAIIAAIQAIEGAGTSGGKSKAVNKPSGSNVPSAGGGWRSVTVQNIPTVPPSPNPKPLPHGGPPANSTVNINVSTQTNASASDIARQIAWQLKTAAV